MNMDYTDGVDVGDRVEIHPGFDLWMRGAKYGIVRKVYDSPMEGCLCAEVRMDNTNVKRLQRFKLSDLKKI